MQLIDGHSVGFTDLICIT